MSDRARGYFPDRASLAASLAGGVASGLLYSSLFLILVFLIPVQIVFGRSGMLSGIVAALSSLVAAALGIWLRYARAGISDPGFILVWLIPAILFLAALAVMNAGWWRGRLATFRIILPSAVCALIALPGLVATTADESLAREMEKWLESLFAAVGGEGYDVSAMAFAAEPAALVDRVFAVIRNSYAASIFMMLGLSWMIGNRLAGEGSNGRSMVGPVASYRLPFAAVWVFLGSWTGILAAVVVRVPEAISAVVWNIGVAAAMAYWLQGFGAAAYLLRRWKVPTGLRIVAALFVVLLHFSKSGVIAAAALALFGVTETWIPYRNLKESENESNS